METFIWKDSFNIGVHEIDDQHRLFLDYVHEAENAAAGNRDSEITDATIYDLKVYASTHFRFEEQLMLDTKYPALWQHAEQHAYFESQVKELEQMAAAGRHAHVISLLQFLRDWFLKHILDCDRKLAAHLAKGPASGRV